MEVGILGPLRLASDDGRVLDVGGTRRRALLALLVLDANRAVAAELLVDRLWDGKPPATATGTLQSHISHLRRVLGPDRIETVGASYRLRLDPGELDADAFEADLAAARDLRTAGDPAGAADALARALARWRGRALAELGGSSWAIAEAARLDELRIVATESLLEARLDLGRHAEVIADAEAAIAQHPLRERLWGHLITALYRDGRQADALRAYQRLRQVLADELGIDPSPELRALEAAILAQDPSLGAVPVSVPDATTAPLPSGVVTFLLTDVVGSTRLWETAPSAMAQALARHDAVIRGAVEAHGGTLLKARGEGDSTFSVFRRATDAVAAARSAALSLEAEPWPADAPIVVRAALHTGEVLERDGDYYGRAVNRAARLRGAAEPGQILLSRASADLVVDHLPADARLHDVGELALPDLDRAEAAYALVTEGHVTPPTAPGVMAAVPFPHRLASTGPQRFVGRTPEKAALDRLWKATLAAEAGIVLVSGEPGIGKTSLAAESAKNAYAAGAVVLYGRCDADVGVAYLPWVEAIEHLACHCDVRRLEAIGPRALADLARLVPPVTDRVAGVAPTAPGDPDGDRYRLFAAVTSALSILGRDQPLMLVVDDLHWADKPTLDLLRHVVSAVTGKVLVIGTYRPSDLTVDHPLSNLLATFRRETNVQRINLAGLADDEVVDLVESLAGQPISGPELGLVHAVRRETEGNPFFTRELLQHLVETGVVTRDEVGRWVVAGEPHDVGLPESIREVVSRRVAHLGDVVERVLETASVIGRTFSVDVVEAVVGEAGDQVLDALERAEAASLITTVDVGEFAFAHALVSHALYDGLSATRRARLHARIAEAMETLGLAERKVNELARHWAAAARPTELTKAIAYAEAAGRQALRALAPDEAVRWYTQALELADQHAGVDETHRGAILIGLGRAQRQAGIAAYRETLLEAARLADRAGDVDQLARAALANNRGMFSMTGELDVERIGVLEAALDRLAPGDSATRARLLATLAAELAFDVDGRRRRELSDEATAMARRLGDPVVLVHVLVLRYSAIWTADMLDERTANMAEAREAAAATGNPTAMAWADGFSHIAALEAGDIDEADRFLDRYAEAAERLGMPHIRALAAGYRASQRIRAGDMDEAERLTEVARTLGGALGESDLGTVTGPVVELYWHQHRLDELRVVVESEIWEIGDMLAHRALIACSEGELDDAGRMLDEAMHEGFVDRRDAFMWLARAAMWGEVAGLVGARGHAEVLYDAMLPYRERLGTAGPNITTTVPHSLGVLALSLGRDAEADDLFARAIALAERVRSVFHTARAQTAWGRALIARPNAEDVRRGEQLLSAALETATRFGCDGVARNAADALASLARRTPPLPAALQIESVFPFAGRADDLASCMDAWADARAGRRRVVLVSGEPGIGKTRLVLELARSVDADGGWVAYGRCDEELSAPYLPFVSALAGMVALAPDDAVAAHVSRCAGDLSPLVPDLLDRSDSPPAAPSGEADVERIRLFAATQDLLAELASRAPLMLVLDDLHWADASTLLLLRYIVISDPTIPVLLVGTYRDAGTDMGGGLAELLAALWREPGVEHVTLSGLAGSEVAHIMDRLAGQPLGAAGESLAEAISDRSSGNPFFVTELLRHVFETGVAALDDDGRWALVGDIERGALPTSVRDVVLSRTRRLGEDAERTLVLAAAVGREFDLALVAQLAQRNEDEVLDELERAVSSGLAVEVPGAPGRFSFSHALVVEALLSTLTATRAARIHRRVAELLEATGARAAEIANHWVAAGDDARARPWALRAGDEAHASVAFDEAARWYAVALQLAGDAGDVDDADRFELLFQLGRAQRDAGMPAHRDTLLEAARVARANNDVHRFVRAALANTTGGLAGFAPADHERIILLRDAITDLGSDDSPLRARLLATLALELRDAAEPAERRRLATEAIAVAERLDDAATLLRVLNLCYLALVQPETLGERLQMTARAVDLAVELEDIGAESWARNWRYLTLLEAADISAADESFSRIEEIEVQLRRPARPHLLFHRANRARLAGDVARAEVLGAEARRLAVATGFGYIAAGDAVHDARLAGRYEVVADVLDREPDTPILAKPELAMAYAGLGRDEEARALLDGAASHHFSGALLGYEVGTHAMWAMVAVRLEAAEHATTLYERLLPWAGRAAMTGSPVCGVVDHHLGALARVLGRHDEALAHLAAAETAHQRMGAAYWLAATRLERARVLVEREDGRAAAEDLLTDVLAIARERGYGEVERDATALLGAF